MDLSGVIFVALAIAWAVYLIPKALQQHDELARTRSVMSFSSRLRVFGGRSADDATRTDDVVVEEDVAIVSVREAAARPPVSAPLVTRAAARRAAARRRRVLGVLTVLLLITVVLAALSVVGWWAVAVPTVMIVAFLVIARISVRRQRGARIPVMTTTAPVTQAVADLEDATEDTVGVSRSDLAAAGLSEQPVADEGSLWDPLPVTLPTYVTKPAARRTVRTIELTRREVTSSGHDAADSQLVREAEAATEPEVEATEQRRVAGA